MKIKQHDRRSTITIFILQKIIFIFPKLLMTQKTKTEIFLLGVMSSFSKPVGNFGSKFVDTFYFIMGLNLKPSSSQAKI